MPPQISIVVPAYKAARFLRATLDSVLAQTRTDWECVVVDDGSPDTSAAIAQQCVERDTGFALIRQPNGGVSAARNTGLRHLSPGTRYVAFLDSDDVWEPDTLELLTQALDAHPEAAGAHGLARGIDATGLPQQTDFEQFGHARYGYRAGSIIPLAASDPTTFDSLVVKFSVYPPCLVLLRREVATQIGPWDVGMSRSEDWEYFARAARLGPLVFVDHVIAGYRKHGSNVSDHGDTTSAHRLRKQIILRRLTNGVQGTPAQSHLALAAFCAWNKYTRAAKMRAALTAWRCGQRRAALRAVAEGVILGIGQTTSLFDLSLHRVLRQPPPYSVS